MNIALFYYLFQVFCAIPTTVLSHAPSSNSLFQVSSLPDSPTLPTSWAGRLPVPGRQGNEIFFWLFEAEEPAYDENLIIWLNGGPGCSSLIGLTTGNGPIAFASNSTRLISNPYSWTKLGHVLYVDQPVGTGFSLASSLVRTNEQVTADLVVWLHALFKQFPHLQSKKVHLMGESYAGIFVPYLASALVQNHSFPINLHSMSLGDGSWGNAAAMSSVAMSTYMHSQKSHLNIPEKILSAFALTDEVCGFDTVLQEARTYPPIAKIQIPGNPEFVNYRRLKRRDEGNLGILDGSCDTDPSTPSEIINSILNSSCYGPCATFSTAENYMYSHGTEGNNSACFSMYDLTHSCTTIDYIPLLEEYFSRDDVQEALHIPDSGTYSACNDTILATLTASEFVEPPEYEILPLLVTKHNISLHIYDGEMDMLINHVGVELSIQNMTWRGLQGFQKRPSRAFHADDAAPATRSRGEVAGIWAAERGVSYHFFEGAGHSVFATKQKEMFAFVRDVVVGGRAG
ncbi:Peptidase S10 serine carboxypeptidase [Penicillium odoratum]|uniref:Peptidase S10 serine carboxypeptidase n=1 Tax=Penicillium odoratum TaxID=1167516 RepID=UPI0025489EFC|nr:Peptidase S10 serine carboxypeptidase [Penicillium odoratum]KAJ5759725.1 Peptidase S10 serine carboxypeptidase [Penicillium odoratum]